MILAYLKSTFGYSLSSSLSAVYIKPPTPIAKTMTIRITSAMSTPEKDPISPLPLLSLLVDHRQH